MDVQDRDVERIQFVSREIGSAAPQQAIPSPTKTKRVAASRPRRSRPRARTRGVRGARQRGAFIVKAGICAVVALFALMLKLLPWQWVADTRTALHSLFTYDLEFDESLGRLKFVQAIFPGVTAVFGSQSTLYHPVNGQLHSAYGADGQNHVVFKAEAGASVKVAAAGVVSKRGVHAAYGNYLMVEHEDAMVTIYYGLGYSSLEQGAQVAAGAVIGTLGDTGLLVFELRVAGKAQNPLRFLGAQ
jgi:murein DD-endopeptidase MepM/ murein hydrolase activator NlpD